MRVFPINSSQSTYVHIPRVYLLVDQEISIMRSNIQPILNASYGSTEANHFESGAVEIIETKPLNKRILIGSIALICAVVVMASGKVILNGRYPHQLRAPVLGWTNPSKLHYHVYVIRHAEMKYQAIHKCDPPQLPMLSASIGYCNNWGDNRCGGDYLIEQGHVRARCIVETVPFDGLAKMYMFTFILYCTHMNKILS
jgi:hypothetical protein